MKSRVEDEILLLFNTNSNALLRVIRNLMCSQTSNIGERISCDLLSETRRCFVK